jgi:subtilase-type serine protease
VNLPNQTTIISIASFSNENGGTVSIVSGILETIGTFSNGGTVTVASGLLDIRGAFSQTGDTSATNVAAGASLQTAGNLTVDSGSFAVDGTWSVGGNLTLRGGVLLTGSGTVMVNNGTGTLDNVAGIVSPGDSNTVGTLTIAGNYVQEANGVLAIRLGHDDNGPLFDQLHVTRNATLQSGSTLSLAMLDSFFCNPGDSFDVLRVDGLLTGAFSNLPGLPDCLTPQYGNHGLILVD